MKYIFKFISLVLAVVVILFLLGPKAPEPVLDAQIHSLGMVDLEVIQTAEKRNQLIKAGNEAMTFWIDTPGVKTEYALVYLHGFSASRGEGDPIHLEFARRYGMNAYLARLDEHGLSDKDALLNLTPESLLESAKNAIAVGKLMGEKVVVMSCSTGSTLALYLAAKNPEWIDALICYSPNIDTYDQATHLVDGPWGLQLLRIVEGGKYHSWTANEDVQQFWSTTYRNEAIIDLRQLVDATMIKETFNNVKQPVLVLYYYKSEGEQDKTVSIPAIKEMFEHLGTSPDKKRMLPVPDAGHHVLASRYQSQDLETVRKLTFSFAEEVLGLRPDVIK
ncbi:MAG: alpha/beta hydrolase [Saprospiraceae bacterium]|nr:alpha/beta hydrolase [Saprospiraceae bacterium]